MGGFVSNEMNASRIVSRKEITDLSAGFESAGKPFSMLIIPKANIIDGVVSQPDNLGLMVDCQCFQDAGSAETFIPFCNWTEEALIGIAVNAIDLTSYRVFVGAGAELPTS